MNFETIEQFKARTSVTKIDIVKNPNTSKLFAATNTGVNYKVEQEIDSSLPIKFMFEDGKPEEGCFCNVKPGNAPVFSL